MKNRFPGFKRCLAMMRKNDAQTQEEGFVALKPHASEYIHELIEEFDKERKHGLRCWLIELVGSAMSPDAFDFLAEQLRSHDESFRYWAIWGLKNLGTKEARTLLWQARSFTFNSPAETEKFRSDFDTILKQQKCCEAKNVGNAHRWSQYRFPC